MECEKEELERDIKNNWMDVLQRERMSESRKENGHKGRNEILERTIDKVEDIDMAWRKKGNGRDC